MGMHDIDKQIMDALEGAGLDTFSASFHPTQGDPVECKVTRDTLELPNDYGVPTIQSGAQIGYLLGDIGNPSLGEYFEFDGKRYLIENKVPSQDSSWRIAHCRVEVINE
jgi:hypothetical protein